MNNFCFYIVISICSKLFMNSVRKIVSLFFAGFLIFINLSYYSVFHYSMERKSLDKSEVTYFVSADQTNNFVLDKKSSSQEFHGWKTKNYDLGFCALDKSISEPPRLKVIRKIFVVDCRLWTPCKSLILYPFHEFS